MEENKERIAKKIARCGICSRRDAERKIEKGLVFVNGVQLTTPAVLVSDKDRIVVDGHVLGEKPKSRLWIYHKPNGLIVSAKDKQSRPTIFEKIPKKMGHIISVGRLDLNSEGLLLLTNDGELARRLELPSSHIRRTYRVRISGKLTPTMIEQIKKGVRIKSVQYKGADIECEKESLGKNQWIKITLSEGKNREIRKIMEYFGFSVSRLIRISYGPYELGDLKSGQIKEVKICV